MTSMTMPLVEMTGISKRFGGVEAVHDMSLTLNPGEVLALLGHNGAGKSSLIKVLSGANQMDAGEIRVMGSPVRISTPRHARDLGIETIYQTLALADNLTTPENIFFGREICTWWGALDEAAMERASIDVMRRLSPNFGSPHKPVKYLSGGQRQSVAIARALQFNARIVIMDEPTAALGPQEAQMVSEVIGNLKNEGLGVIIVSHDLNRVFEIADRLCVMKNGRHVWTGDKAATNPDDVLEMIILGKRPDGSIAPGIQ